VYLIDTNIWIELLLEQERSEQVRHLFNTVDADQLAITEFSVYSIGIILARLRDPLTALFCAIDKRAQG
jgi:uncharacterized protein